MSLFRRALEADPRCALAYAGLSEALVRKFLYWDGDEAFLQRVARPRATRAGARRRAAPRRTPRSASATALGPADRRAARVPPGDPARQRRVARPPPARRPARRARATSRPPRRCCSARSRSRRSYISTYDHLYNVLQRLDRYEEAIETADRGHRRRAQAARARRPTTRTRACTWRMLLRAHGQPRRGPGGGRAARSSSAPRTATRPSTWRWCTRSLGNAEESLEALTSAQERGYYIRYEQRSTEFDILRGLPQFQELVA